MKYGFKNSQLFYQLSPSLMTIFISSPRTQAIA
jgi:hypothetical protein